MTVLLNKSRKPCTALLVSMLCLCCTRGTGLAGDAAHEDASLEEQADYRDTGLDGDDTGRLDGNELDYIEHEEIEDALESEEAAALPPCDPPVIENLMWEGCGDGIRGEGEECDDANALDGDGCTWDCRVGDGSSGIAGPSPLSLDRFCRVDDTYKVVELLEDRPWYLQSIKSTLFWWTGSEYRVFYGDRIDEDHIILKITAFDRQGQHVEPVFEMIVSDTEEYRVSYVYPSLLDENIEIFIGTSFHAISDPFGIRCEVIYSLLNENGDALIDGQKIPILSSEDDFFFCFGAGEGINRLFHVENITAAALRPAMEDRGFVIERLGSDIEVCAFGFENILYYQDVVMAIGRAALFERDRDGHYILLGAARYAGSGDYNFLLGTPAGEHFPTDFIHKKICKAKDPNSTRFMHDADIELLESGFALFVNCKTVPDGFLLYVPHFLVVSETGGLAGPPTKILPEGHPCLDLGRCYLEDVFSAIGNNTMGVFLSRRISYGDSSLFQTLDLEGRQVGEPCEDPPYNDGIIDVVWDGEGYGVASMQDDGIYFWRFLPE